MSEIPTCLRRQPKGGLSSDAAILDAGEWRSMICSSSIRIKETEAPSSVVSLAPRGWGADSQARLTGTARGE